MRRERVIWRCAKRLKRLKRMRIWYIWGAAKAGLGTCMLTIIGLVAQRHGLDIRGTRVSVVKEMASQPVRRIASLRAVITVAASARLSADDKVRWSAERCNAR